MITLVATNEFLKLTTDSAAELNFCASYNEMDAPAISSVFPLSAVGIINSIGTTTIVGAPATGNIRQIKGIFITNVDPTDSVDVKVVKVQATLPYQLHPTMTLAPGEAVEYLERCGWVLYNANSPPALGPFRGVRGAGPQAGDRRLFSHTTKFWWW